ITFGSPCQDLSIAGKRNGLDGSQSGLFFHAVKVIKEMRCATNGRYPRFCVWENVPGAFSSNSGEDFRTVLEEICKVSDSAVSVPRPAKWAKAGEIMADSYSVAWRVLDACGWGIPQRRKRIYLVADFDGQCAGKILFESEDVSRYSAESFRAWQRTARSTKNCFETPISNLILCDQGGERMDVLSNISATLRAEAHHPPCVLSKKTDSAVPTAIALENHPADSRVNISNTDICQTLTSRCGTGGGNVPLLLQNRTAYCICSIQSNAMMSDNPHSGFYETKTSRTIDANGGNPLCNQGGTVVLEGKSFCFSQDTYDRYSKNLQCGALKASGGSYGGGSETFIYSPVIDDMQAKLEYIVRKLTPQ
ncbi:MAG: DNA cytosine methyltransferase, partial [Oscillospiraceae bacterium]|nr:DNA cytosine methyltransferase [Oscillospiraceae bacterium]